MQLKLWFAGSVLLSLSLLCIGCRDFKAGEINLNKYQHEISLPAGWHIKKQNSARIRFEDWLGREKGGVFLVGYFPDPNRFLGGVVPNHAQPIRLEQVKTSIGKGYFLILDRDYPAASGNQGHWQETHVIIPIPNQDLAYDFWLHSAGSKTTTILQQMLKFKQGWAEAPLPLLDYDPPSFDPDRSITYHKPYRSLKAELRYARIFIWDGDEKRTIRKIDDKNRLVEIVREFDRLKASPKVLPYPTVDGDTSWFGVTVWRHVSSLSYETSVSHVLMKRERNYFYRETPILIKEVTPQIIKLLELDK